MSIIEDKREIQDLYICDPLGAIEVGELGVTAIRVYGQGALHCDTPWFAIYKGEELIRRINGFYVISVRYRDENQISQPGKEENE